MNFKKIFLYLLLVTMFSAKNSLAQKSTLQKTNKVSKVYYSLELALTGGESHYYGDLTSGIIQTKNIHTCFGAFLRYQRGRNWAAKLMYQNGMISGDDAFQKKDGLRTRNLNFYAPFQEGSLTVEYMYPEFTVCKQHNWAPYLTAGVALLKYTPQSKLHGQLQPLSTEGQGLAAYPDRTPYKTIIPTIPFGIGIKYIPAKRIIIGAEFLMRKTFTDYLDDVSKTYPSQTLLAEQVSQNAANASFRSKSNYPNNNPEGYQRGNPMYKDWYCTTMIYLSYTIKYDCAPEKHRYNDVGGCKSF